MAWPSDSNEPPVGEFNQGSKFWQVAWLGYNVSKATFRIEMLSAAFMSVLRYNETAW